METYGSEEQMMGDTEICEPNYQAVFSAQKDIVVSALGIYFSAFTRNEDYMTPQQWLDVFLQTYEYVKVSTKFRFNKGDRVSLVKPDGSPDDMVGHIIFEVEGFASEAYMLLKDPSGNVIAIEPEVSKQYERA